MLGIKKYKIYAAIVISTLLITLAHFVIFRDRTPNVVLEELYYIPLLLGALFFGLRGAIITYIFVSLAYLPFFSERWTPTALGLIDRGLHLLFSAIFTILAGFLTEQYRKYLEERERDRYLSNIGRVAATIVHDLKNPLITIMGFAKRIQEKKGDTVEAAQSISESAQKMQKIVNDVLEFSKPFQLELEEKDFREVVKKAIESCKAKAEEAKVIISAVIQNNPIPCVVDEFLMERALVNLINNAIEASSIGQKVFVTLNEKKKYLIINIKDEGTGMSAETLENFFVPFYTTKKEGTGLGAAIAKKIIDAHKGRIKIMSTEGIGTVVSIEIPIRHI